MIHFPFNFLKASIRGVWNLNLLLLKIPLIPFYFLKKTFHGIASIASQNLELLQHGNNEQLHGVSAAAENAVSDGREDSEFDVSATQSDGSCSLNAASEYNESDCSCEFLNVCDGQMFDVYKRFFRLIF